MERSHWVKWHDEYDDPHSPLSARLAEVQRQLRHVLDEAPTGPLRLIALCAGRGHDVLDVLADHPRVGDVSARLVELDPDLAHDAATIARERELTNVEVVVGDASRTDAYDGAVPADVVLACGVFGNISLSDIEQTIRTLPSLCARHARVVWTRGRRPPDRTGDIRAMFEENGFGELAFVAPKNFLFTVGTAQLDRAPDAFLPGVTMFSFVSDGVGPS